MIKCRHCAEMFECKVVVKRQKQNQPPDYMFLQFGVSDSDKHAWIISSLCPRRLTDISCYVPHAAIPTIASKRKQRKRNYLTGGSPQAYSLPQCLDKCHATTWHILGRFPKNQPA